MASDLTTLNPDDWSTIQPLIDQLLATPLPPAGIQDWLSQWSELESHLSEHSLRLYNATTENTADAEAERRYMSFVETIQPRQAVATQQLKEKLLAADTSQLPAPIQSILRRFRAEAELFREENIPLNTELERLSNEFYKLMGAMNVEINGETLTIQQAQKLELEPDRGLRELAWRSVHERYLQDREQLNELFLKMLGLRRQIASNAGKPDYIAYIWQQYGRFDYAPADCHTFHDAIEHEIVPLMRKHNERRQRQLGLDSMRPWDIDVDALNRPPLAPFGAAAELEEGGQRMFDKVDPELGRQYAAMRGGYLELESRPGKAPGGYCGSLPVSKVPYIFMNAVGTHDDVQTLLHEGGHAFHFMESAANNELIWNHNGPMEFCEVASMSMELLAAPYLDREQGGFYSAAEARRARAEHLLTTLRFFPYMAVVDAFQHWVYGEAPATVSAAELDAKWGELWDRFMVGVDWSGLEDYKVTGWHRKLHIFTSPLYYVEYGLASVGALQVWRNALRDQAAAVGSYRQALALGDTRSLPELFDAAGARFAFDRATMAELAALIDEHLAALAE